MKSVSITCPECGTKYSISSVSVESVQFCPFCGEGAMSPYDDLEDDELLDDADEDSDEF